MSAEHRELVKGLKNLKPGVLPKEIFLEIARLWVTTTVHILPIEAGSYPDTRILLFNRGPEDEFWKNLLAAPGPVVLATDENFKNAFDRILNKELEGAKVQEGPVYIGGEPLLQDTERGKDSVLIYWATISGQPKNGTFYSVDTLPRERIIPGQLPRIESALKHFNSVMQARN